ncbi:MutS protein-like 4 [Holothuria leucospilota]|uniref:MutS protein-like 4 n=1 Tax=Holothuria leucospilota TaxID=206669 RepID=A0A9Q1CLW5_HOLLE|nr:MutS protein-like 4 [Holothuria leucospilota]
MTSSNNQKYSFPLVTTPCESRAHLPPSNQGQFKTPTPVQGSSSVGPSRAFSSLSHGRWPRKRPYSSSTAPASSSRSGTNTPFRTSSTSGRTPSSRRTPYQSTSSTTPAGVPKSSTILAIVEGRGQAHGEIGLACIDLRQPILTLSQFSDSQTYVKVTTKIQIYQPLEIIMPHTACDGGNMTKLYKVISDNFESTPISTVQRKYFNETKGIQYVKQLCASDFSAVEMELSSKYYCLAAGAALLKYVEFIQNIVYAPNSLKVVFKGSERTTMIDATTARNLELVQNMKDVKSEHTLFGVLNYTSTSGGARLLRANILQPPCDHETIKLRLDVVEELTQSEEAFFNLQTVLSKFLDVDHLLSLCVQIPKQETVKTAENKITNVIYLKHVLELVEPLIKALQYTKSELLQAYYKTLDDQRFGLILEKIRMVIHDDTRYQKGTLSMRTQKCFAVRPEINGLLDVARRTYTEVVDDISMVVKQLAEKTGWPLKTSYNTSRGFFIQLQCVGAWSSLSAEAMPPEFIKVIKTRNTLSFTTSDLSNVTDRIKESLNEIYLMTNIVVSDLLNEIRDHIGCLYKLTETVAMLDILVAFAHACTLSNYVRPTFSETLAIKQGWHPILEKISYDQLVPNNTCASVENNFIIITGPNMGGKSTYLKQLALLQVMAQIGCFVSAEFASFRLCDQIFSRIGCDDDIETNASTFMLEMREVNYIIQNCSHSSLVIIDELGRGTSNEEGVGICHAVCEYLISLKAFTFFVTHFMEITNLDALYPNVENYHFEVEHSTEDATSSHRLNYTHVMSRGRTQEEQYGIKLAEVSSLPASIVTEAKQISSQLLLKRKTQNKEKSKVVSRQKAVFQLANRLIQAAHSTHLTEDTLRGYLQNLKRQYLDEMKSQSEE